MKTRVNNILIAEFMGWLIAECYVVPTDKDVVQLSLDKEFKEINHYSLKYHKSWEWLMPVLEKIETMFLSPDIFIMYDSREEFKGWYWKVSGVKGLYKECQKENHREKNKIDAVYNAVIEFIKWYNKKTKT